MQSRQQYGIDLIAPTRADHKWQAKEQQGFDTTSFQIDWDAEIATCPAGCESLSWTPAIDRYDNQVIKIKFSSDRLQALRTERALYQSPTPCNLRPYQGTPSSLTRSQGTSKGGGVPGEIPQPIRHRRHHFGKRVRAFGLRRSRYRGMEKTHLQHLIIATVINLVRVLAWVDQTPLAKTRISRFGALALAA